MIRNIRLGTKIAAGFGTILILLAAVSVTGLGGLDRVATQMNNAQDAAALIMTVGETRRQEKNYILRKDPAHVEAVAREMRQATETAEAIKTRSNDPVTVALLSAMEETAGTYTKAFDDYVAMEKKVTEADAAMVVSARQLERTAEAILTASRTGYRKRIQDGDAPERILGLLQSAEDAEAIIRWVLQCRRHEKNFLIRCDTRYYDQVNALIQEIIQRATTMKDRFETALDKNKAQEIITSAQAYRAALSGIAAKAEAVARDARAYRGSFVGLKALKDSQKEVTQTLVSAGREALDMVRQAMDYERQKMETQVASVKRFIQWVTIGAWVVGIFTALIITRGITRPLNRIIQDIAKGDLTSRLDVRGQDEVGQLARGFNTLTAAFQDILRQLLTDSALLDALSKELSTVAAGLNTGAGETADKAHALSLAATDMTTDMSGVAAAAEQSSGNAAMVAAAAEEMTATISRIAGNADQARKVSRSAVEQTRQSFEKISQLSQATQAINQVTEAITNISDQINLLALNATIEAARAGAAGRGFAVVAGEIKILAGETTAATLTITDQIREIQKTIGSTVADIDESAAVIQQVDEIVVSISQAIEEQSTATGEIAQSIVQVSRGIEAVSSHTTHSASLTQVIAGNIEQVKVLADGNTTTSRELKACAGRLTQMVSHQEGYLKRFKI